MPQDSLRSVVYRSFVTCDDPKGVVECKTIRKSKSDSRKMEEKMKNQRIQQTSDTSTSFEEERKDKVHKGSKEELLQIMEVSRGAQKLNEVIDSWSNRTSFDKQSKCIAKDLLKGALDLQESLSMLSKLQEASEYIAKSKKMHKEKDVGGRVDVGTEFMDSDPFGDYDKGMDLQKPRISTSGFSRDCYDELREVIRESFARQNLLPKVSPKEKDFLDRKSLDLCVDIPSSSSSHSSLIHSHSSSCSPSKIQHEKTKGSNLIAKLMGLEEVPRKAVNSVVYKQVEKEKLSNQRAYLLDIDLPRARKPQFMVQKVVQERRTLEEMIETMQFKGLLVRKSIDGSNYGKDRSNVSFLRKSLAVEGPPIVIMKPRHVHDLRAEEPYYSTKGKPIKSRQMPRNMREEFRYNAVEVPRGQLKFTETNEKLQAGRSPKQKLNKNKEGKHAGESPARPIKKTLDIQESRSSTKINHSRPLVPRAQKKETIVKQKIEGIPKVASNMKKQAERKDGKSQECSETKDLGKTSTLRLSPTTKGSNVSKYRITRGKATVSDKHIHMQSTALESSISKKNLQKGKSDCKPSVENLQSGDNLPIKVATNIHGPLTKSTTIEQITDKAARDSHDPISGSPCESSEPTIEDDVNYGEDGSCIPRLKLDDMKDCKSITHIRYLLLSSVSFLNRADELFDLGTCDPRLLQTARSPDREMLDASLLLECAKEILELKSLHCTRTVNPLSQNLRKKPKCHLSLEQLVGEITDVIEDLRNYSKSCCEPILVDSINSMLERDLRWNGKLICAWDSGWKNGLTLDEVNAVVTDVEKLVFSEIVDDLVTELMC
ncbi:uncharacterized protein LOC105173522 isoform X2 [Sesamum indicum]|uniref:Uncharacterized protein LOC105173522 isoform X2 n=1 Tax=Sesamum indicum TaxID=4182 RepID=A0A6I9U7B0_SESIN|nr:uncharacterized protein LOC105173522 isoform X2 [Sesamum indicum]